MRPLMAHLNNQIYQIFPMSNPINILQHKFYATLFFQANWLATQIFNQSKCLKISLA